MPVNAARRPARLSDSVARRLAQWIEDAQLQPGMQLPTEKALGERFGVSRAVIREAVARLKADGCVRTRQGSGAYVAARPGEASFRLTPEAAGEEAPYPPDLSDVFELRFLLETGAAELAAVRATAADLARMQAALQRMDLALQVGANAAHDDDAFHVAVATATQNPQLARFQLFMGAQLSASRVPSWNEAAHRSGRAEQSQQEHRRIFDAIAAADPAAARKAAAAHLIGAAMRFGLDAERWRMREEMEGQR